MPHFCGHTHSTRDRRGALMSDNPVPRAGDPFPPRASTSSIPAATVAASPATGARPAAPEFAPPPRLASPTREQIARLAYSFWEARGRNGGSPEEDWFRAEQELRGF